MTRATEGTESTDGSRGAEVHVLHQQTDSYSERSACPLYTAIGVLSGRWKPMIIQRLARGPHGFGELQRAMPRVTPKVLREQLRQLEADGLVKRRALTPARLGIRYALTPYAKTLDPVFGALLKWGMRHLAKHNTANGTRIAPPTGLAPSPAKERRV